MLGAALDGGRVLVGIREELHGLDPATGKVLWRKAGRSDAEATRVLAAGQSPLLVGEGREGLTLFEVSADGAVKERWTARGARARDMMLAVSGERLYHASDRLYCRDLATGRELWRCEIPAAQEVNGAAFTGSVAVGAGCVLVGRHGTLYAVADRKSAF